MKNYIKSVLIITISLTLITSCSKEDDYEIPPFKSLMLAENFEGVTTGSGSTEIPISLEGWVNANLGTGAPRVWIGKTFSNNKFAEFSSFYGASGTSDDVWLITSPLDLSVGENKGFSFSSVNRFYNGSVLKVYISEDYDGTIPGITTATWTELNPILPTSSAENDVKVSSGEMDLSSYTGTNARIAFRYQGSKASNPTTTFQLDDIKVYEK